MKKCVSDGPVSPMPQEWWSEILSMIPQELIKSPLMQPYIQDLYDELMKEYDKSMRKAMGNCSISSLIFLVISVGGTLICLASVRKSIFRNNAIK